MNEDKRETIKWDKVIYRFLYSLLLLFCVLFAAGNLCGLKKIGIWHIIAGMVMLSILLIFTYFGKRGRFLCGISVVAILTVIVLFMTPQNVLIFLKQYDLWIWGYSTNWRGDVAIELGCEILQVIIIAIVCYVIQSIIERFWQVQYGIAIGYVGVLAFCLFTKKPISHMGTVFLIGYIVLSYTEWTKRKWEKAKSRDTKSFMLWIMPFLITYFILLSIVPAYKKPYDWKLVKGAYRNAREWVTTIFFDLISGDSEDFELSFSGFSENPGLGGNLLENKKQMMTVKSSAKKWDSIYLTGNIYDSFDGKQWLAKAQTYPQEEMMDALETICTARSYQETHNEILSEEKLTIRYSYFQSGYLFAPLKTTTIRCEEDYDINADIKFKKKQGYGTTYDISFWKLNMETSDYYERLDENLAFQQADWDDISKWYFTTGNKPSWEDVQIYRKAINDNYMQLDGISEETQAYIEKITDGETTTYGTLKAIEKELSSYTYTKSPGNIPSEIQSGEAFLDYFLESKEGYCSYFTTAFVLMARAKQIPARYVEGFCFETRPGKETIVYSSDAHAWPEAYIDGIGWIPFEPTPGYGKLRYTDWDTESNSNQETSTDDRTHFITEETEEVMEVEKQHDNQAVFRLLKIIGLTLLTVVLISVLFLLMERLIYAYRYKHMTREEKFVAETKRNMRLLTKLKIERTPFETLQELKKRGESNYPEITLHFLQYLEAYTYGKKSITEEMYQETLNEQKNLLELMKKRILLTKKINIDIDFHK